MRPNLEDQPTWAKALRGPRRATFFYKIMEAARMAADLYSWNNKFFLLAKGAADDSGETAWWAITLDPDVGSELTRVRLPTDATNLTVIPGDLFALIEKGRVEGFGDEHYPVVVVSSHIRIFYFSRMLL